MFHSGFAGTYLESTVLKIFHPCKFNDMVRGKLTVHIDRGQISMEIFWVGYICISPPRNRQSVHLKIHPFQLKGNSSSKSSFWGFQLLALVFYYFLFDPWFLGSTSEPNSELSYSVSGRFGRSKKLRLRWFTQDAWGVLKQEDNTPRCSSNL